MTVASALEHLVGMQSQVPTSPYVGLWSRIAAFEPDQLSRLLANRNAVRTALMRNTLHLVTAADCLALRPVVHGVLTRAYVKGDSKTMAAIVDAGRAIVEAQPRTNMDLGQLLRLQFPDHDAETLGYAVRNHLALVQLPPRGLWGKRGAAMLATAESWIGRPLASSSRPDEMIRRYLRAFGPASVADMQAWSGVTGLRESAERLRPTLVSMRDEAGRELFDVRDGVRPRASAAAPVRFLPEFDNVLVAYAERSRIIRPEHRTRVMPQLGRPFILIDGFVGGFWRIRSDRKEATLEVDLFSRAAPRERAQISAEGIRLLDFAVPGVSKKRVRLRKA
jgi:hypothetical protein